MSRLYCALCCLLWGCELEVPDPEYANVTLCRADESGSCSDASRPPPGPPGLCLPETDSELSVGSTLFVTAKVKAVPTSQEPVLTLSASGAVRLVDGSDLKPGISRSLLFKSGETNHTFELRAVDVGSGKVTVVAPWTESAKELKFDIGRVASAGLGAVRHLGINGTKSVYTLHVCARAGVRDPVELRASSGAVLNPAVSLVDERDESCPDDFPRSGVATWEGVVPPLTVELSALGATQRCNFPSLDFGEDVFVRKACISHSSRPHWTLDAEDEKATASWSVAIHAELSDTKGESITLNGTSVTVQGLHKGTTASVRDSGSEGLFNVLVSTGLDRVTVPLVFVVDERFQVFLEIEGPARGSHEAGAAPTLDAGPWQSCSPTGN